MLPAKGRIEGRISYSPDTLPSVEEYRTPRSRLAVLSALLRSG